MILSSNLKNSGVNFKSILKFILCISLPLLIGAVSGIATSANIPNWYVTLNKPSFNPPNYLFAPVWTTLYLLMGISFYLILKTPQIEQRKKAVIAFTVQLCLNFMWSFLFFAFHAIGFALIEIIMLLCCILWMIFTFYKINKIAAIINIPYILWVSFASILNASIYILNC